MGGIASCTMTNKYSSTIWVKYDVEKKYVRMEDYTIQGEVGFAEASVGASGSVNKTYDWVKINAQFTPIPTDDFIESSVDCRDRKIMYVTIVGEDGKVICNTLGKTDKNLIVAENGQLRSASEKDFTEVHPWYGKMKPTGSGSVKKNPPTAIAGIKSNAKCAEERTTGKPRRCSAQKSLRIILKAEDYDAERHCFISGMALTDNGTVLLTDWINSNIKSALIKSVSQDSEALSVLPLPSNPRAITVPYTTTAVVAAFNEKLYIISITDDTYLSLREEFKLDFQIEAMVAYNGNLAVTCDTHPRTTKLITLDGRVLWSVSKDTTGQDLFACPCGITITSITDTTAVVVVSDLSKNTLTLLEAQTGKFIRSIDVGEGKGPYGITTDSDGNVYVCYKKTYEICFWSADFQESKILLSGDPRVRRPCCIVYSAVDDSLYVSFGETHGWNEIDSFRLV